MNNAPTISSVDTIAPNSHFAPRDILSPTEERAVDGFPLLGYKPAAGVLESKALSIHERTRELLSKMKPQQRSIEAILLYCAQPKTVSDTNNYVSRIQQSDVSVYDAASLCALLEKAGSLMRVDSSGHTFDASACEPEIIESDGTRYLEAKNPEESYWVASAEALDALAEARPESMLQDLLQAGEEYVHIYQWILKTCSNDGGANLEELQEINNDPLLQSPLRLVTYFIERLENCGALTWEKSWKTTHKGLAALGLLVDTAEIPAEPEKR